MAALRHIYNGYATGNVPSNLQPLRVDNSIKDSGGVTVDNQGNITARSLVETQGSETFDLATPANFTITENDNKIDVFFDNQTFNLVGWQTSDIYQNSAFTLLYSIKINQDISKNLFKLPAQN